MLEKSFVQILFLVSLIFLTSELIDDSIYTNDILVSDVSNITYSEVSHLLGEQYLSETRINNQSKFTGIMWGSHRRLFINLPVRLKDIKCPKFINVIFKVDTGAGITTLTNEVLEKLHELCSYAIRDEVERNVEINGKKIVARNSTAHYNNLNILGSDFMHRHSLTLTAKYSEDVKEEFYLEFEANTQNIIEERKRKNEDFDQSLGLIIEHFKSLKNETTSQYKIK